jgi:ABC-type transporter Mla MlaB component
MKHILNPHSQTLTLVFTGDVLSTNVGTLRQEIFTLLESEEIKRTPWQTLDLDLTASRLIDSMGLNLLVSVIKLARNRSAKVVGRIASPNVQRALLFTRLNTQMELVMAA